MKKGVKNGIGKHRFFIERRCLFCNIRRRGHNIHRDILCDRNTDDDSCGVGSVHGEKHCRQDRGFEDMGDDLK